jgi:hypothetical protein
MALHAGLLPAALPDRRPKQSELPRRSPRLCKRVGRRDSRPTDGTPLLAAAACPHVDVISTSTRCPVVVRQRPQLTSITPALPSQLPSALQTDTLTGGVPERTSTEKWRQIKENTIWRRCDVVRAEGLEPSRHGLKVSSQGRSRDRPPTFMASVESVFPVLTPLLETPLAGHPFADVRGCRPARQLYCQFCCQIEGRHSTLRN